MKKSLIACLRPLLCAALLLCTPVVLAATGEKNTSRPVIAVTIHPLALIVQAIGGDTVEVRTLLTAADSPHHITLKPSQRATLQQASLVVWMGPSLETWLVKPMAEVSSARQVVILDAMDHDDLIAGAEHGHQHDDAQVHGTPEGDIAESAEVDPHVWLDPMLAGEMANIVSRELGKHFPAHATFYQQQLDGFLRQVLALDAELMTQWLPLRDMNWVVYHNAYAYLVRRYDLREPQVVLTPSAGQPGARHRALLRQYLQQQQVHCAFTEPQFDSAALQSLVSGLPVVVDSIDPNGWGARDYPAFLRGLSDQISGCLIDAGAHRQ